MSAVIRRAITPTLSRMPPVSHSTRTPTSALTANVR